MSDLVNLISQCASDMAGDDAVKIAHNVAEATPSRRLREFYAEALTPLVRMVLNDERNRVAAKLHGRRHARGGRTHSPKAKAMRSAWDEYLDTVVTVEEGTSKKMRDVTVKDLDVIIGRRESHIASVQVQVDYYRRMRAAMVAHGARTVGKLAEPVE